MSDLTENQQRNLKTNEAGFDAFQRGDTDGLLALFDPEIDVYSPPTLANSGSFRGPEGYLKWVTDWLEAWEEFNVEIGGDVDAVGNRHVITPVHQTAVGRGSGVPVEMDLCFMAEFDGERFVALHLYTSPEEAREIAEHRESVTSD
jgi:ketosteroid isomerase-like protein